MPDHSLEYRNKFLKRQLQYDTKFRKIFNKVAEQFAALSNDPNAKFTKSFKYNGAVNKKIDAIIEAFHKDVLDLTELEIEKSWGLSNEKNDLIVRDYLKTISTIKATQSAKYFMPNIPALKAFISGKHGTETLSDAIWKVATQARGEMQIHLGIGLMNGDSAPVISRRIRQYLKQPDALFRRIRDNKGRLIASKAMLENHPGQGVYNSSYKNALRLTRTNTNQAYLLADHERWLRLPMVIGVHVEISAQHKIFDICDECQGDYPKDFIWVGWHSQCLCHAVAILMPPEDFNAYLKGNKPLQAKQITTYSDKFQKYVKDNFDRYSKYKSTPFWIEDNTEIIKDILKTTGN
jgi:hypothetical protein